MTQAPVYQTIERGWDDPSPTMQFSVFLDNRVGKLLQLLEVFEGEPLRVVALTVVDSADCAVVRMITTDDRLAKYLLEGAKLPFAMTQILIFEVSKDRTLAQACMALLKAELFIHYAYPLMARPNGGKAIALQTDDPIMTAQVLDRKGFHIMSEDDLNEPEEPGAGGPGLDHCGIT